MLGTKALTRKIDKEIKRRFRDALEINSDKEMEFRGVLGTY